MATLALQEIAYDPIDTALAAHLVYVSDTMPGITRTRKGKKGFIYLQNGIPCTDEAQLDRIAKLVIPPAWENVWICPLPNGHLQATGFDALNRKQYRYHEQWSRLRNQTKFYRMALFGELLPGIREQVQKDLALPGLPLRKVLALVISLMEHTFIRIGNHAYERLYGSFGLTTLRDRHVQVNGDSINFRFKGKKGVLHSISMQDRRLARLVKKCRDIPGYELFQYIDEQGRSHCIDSGMVNEYLRSITQCDLTAKDFRTWAGTVSALKVFMELGKPGNTAEARKNLLKVVDLVSAQLGNTRAVCRKYYIHPALIEIYQAGCLPERAAFAADPNKKLSCEEVLLTELLKTAEFNNISLTG